MAPHECNLGCARTVRSKRAYVVGTILFVSAICHPAHSSQEFHWSSIRESDLVAMMVLSGITMDRALEITTINCCGNDIFERNRQAHVLKREAEALIAEAGHETWHIQLPEIPLHLISYDFETQHAIAGFPYRVFRHRFGYPHSRSAVTNMIGLTIAAPPLLSVEASSYYDRYQAYISVDEHFLCPLNRLLSDYEGIAFETIALLHDASYPICSVLAVPLGDSELAEHLFATRFSVTMQGSCALARLELVPDPVDRHVQIECTLQQFDVKFVGTGTTIHVVADDNEVRYELRDDSSW